MKAPIGMDAEAGSEALTPPVDEPRADDGSGQRQQCLMDVESALEADTELGEACEPRVRALHHPAVLAQAFAALDASPGDAAGDAPLPQMCVASPVVLALVRMQLGGALARPARKPFDRRHASTHHSNITESCRLAPLTSTTSGMPRASTMR